MGEMVIFLLFGPVLVMGGYFIQTKVFPSLEAFVLSVPFGLFTTAILFANEIPDFPDDRKVNKLTWVCFLGPQRSFLLYYLLIFLGFSAILLGITLGYLGRISILSFLFIFPAIKAANLLGRYPFDKQKLMGSSKLTIAIQNSVSIILLLGVILR